jgi:HPt (histidine-containing phosphotransfer) domain-containing protein
MIGLQRFVRCRPHGCRQLFLRARLLAMLLKKLCPSAPHDMHASSGGPAASPSFSEAASVLDREALDRLRELDPNNEARLMERVVAAFETSIQRLMPQLQNALVARDMGGIRHVTHTLKSSSASIGAIKLSRICADLEARARQNQEDEIAERVAQMQAEVEIVRVALQRELDF